MFYGITDITTFILGTIFIVLLPGPNSIYVMTIASRHGVGAGYRGACGVFLGDMILMVLSATGAASLLRASPMLFLVVKYAGAGYLAWIGFNLLRAALTIWRQPTSAKQEIILRASGEPLDRVAPHPFRTALLISLMNPKAILFFISFFVQFIDPDYAYPALSFLLQGTIVMLCSAAYLSLLIFGGVQLAELFGRRRGLACVGSGAVGVLFIGFGVKLAGATLN